MLVAEANRRAIKRLRERRLYDLYPETGPLRRELYAKHTEFFSAGARHNERAFVGGNRCITPWTAIETDRGERLASELLGETSLSVRSWADGSVQKMRASGLFAKGIEPAFRVHLDNGEFFDCTRKHRVLTILGWLSFGRLMSLADGLHLMQKGADCQANYGVDGHRRGQSPLILSGSDQEEPPSTTDAQKQIRQEFEREGEGAHKSQCNRAYPSVGHLPILDDPSQIAALTAQFLDPSSEPGVLLCSRSRQELSRLVAALGPQAAISRDDLCPAQWGDFHSPFLPYRHLGLIGYQRIIMVEPLGHQLIIDMEVQDAHNYRAGGVFHHNTGKSFCICFEGVCHLIGWYPEWWLGRRFDRPTIGWAAGEDVKAVRESLQPTLIGPADARGTGLIPAENILRSPSRSGVPDALDFVELRHKSGGTSRLLFKAYEQGRESFQASQIDFGLLDEEPPLPIYTEVLTRTMSTEPGRPNGLLMCAFTPLKGISATVLQFLPGGAYPATEELRKAAWGW